MTHGHTCPVVIEEKDPRNTKVREPGRRERRRNETLEKLFLAAMELFASKGFATTKVEEITEAADVGKGTFFNYFPSKQHVLGYFVGRQLGRVEHYLALSCEGGSSAEELLRNLASDLTRLPCRTPEMARTIVASFLGDAEVREYVMGRMQSGREMVAEIMRHAQERGEFRRDMEAIELARIFQQSMFGTILMWSLQPKTPVARMLDGTLEVLMQGLREPMKRRRGAGSMKIGRRKETGR